MARLCKSLFAPVTVVASILPIAGYAADHSTTENAFNAAVEICSNKDIPPSAWRDTFTQRGWHPASENEKDRAATLMAHIMGIKDYVSAGGKPIPEDFMASRKKFWENDRSVVIKAGSDPIYFFNDASNDVFVHLSPNMAGMEKFQSFCGINAISDTKNLILSLEGIDPSQMKQISMLGNEPSQVFDIRSVKLKLPSATKTPRFAELVVARPTDHETAANFFGSDATTYRWSIVVFPEF